MRGTSSQGDLRAQRRSGSTSLVARCVLAGAVAGLGLLVLPGLAQPEGGRPDRRGPGMREGGPGEPPPGEMGGPMSASDLRARLARRLDDARVIERRLEEAIASLDGGATPEAVMRDMMAPGLPRPMDGWRGGEPRGPLTAEERDRLMARVSERMPRVAMWLKEVEGQEPQLVEAVSNRLAPQLREIERLRERDPEGARVRTEELVATIGVMRATRLYRVAVMRAGAQAPASAEALEGVRSALIEQFEARLAARQHEVAALDARIQTLRADIDAELTGRDGLIDEALSRITQDATRPPRGEPAPTP